MSELHQMVHDLNRQDAKYAKDAKKKILERVSDPWMK
jgi:hypothetical protein